MPDEFTYDKNKKIDRKCLEYKIGWKVRPFFIKILQMAIHVLLFFYDNDYTKTKGKKTKVDTAVPQQYYVLLGKNKILKYEYQ